MLGERVLGISAEGTNVIMAYVRGRGVGIGIGWCKTTNGKENTGSGVGQKNRCNTLSLSVRQGFSVSQVAVTVWKGREFAELLLFLHKTSDRKEFLLSYSATVLKGLCAESR